MDSNFGANLETVEDLGERVQVWMEQVKLPQGTAIVLERRCGVFGNPPFNKHRNYTASE